MSGHRTIKRVLTGALLDGIDGAGSELVFKIRAWRTTKADTHESYELEIKTCRYAVKQLLEQLRLMHVRDRERIKRELARIDNEVNALRTSP